MRSSILAVLVMAMATFACVASGYGVEWVVNGDFEDTSGTFPGGWDIVSGAVLQTTGLGGTATAGAFLPSPWGARILQSGFECGPEWQFDMLLASSDPGDAGARSLNFVLDSGGPHINMRVNGDGSFQAYDGSSWQDVLTGGVTFSEDNSGDVLNVQHLRITGDYTGVSSYTLELTDPNSETFTMNSGAVSYFTSGTPPTNSGIVGLTVKSDSSPGGFVADEISLAGDLYVPPEGLVNGDFEDTSGTFPMGWAIEYGAPAQHAGLGGTDTALYLHKKADGGDRIYQEIVETDPSWNLDFLFATEEPVAEGDRALNLIIIDGDTPLLNLRVDKSGSLQSYTGSWDDVLADAVTFSTDANADGDFEDAGDTLNVYHMRIEGDAEAGEFTIQLSNPNETAFATSVTSSAWTSTPDPAWGADRVTFSASSSTCTGSSVIDEVVLESTVIPEPATITLILGGILILGLFRRSAAS